MNRFILFVILLAFFSCGKQSKESKTETDPALIDSSPALPIQKHATIPMDSTFAHKLSKKEMKSIFTIRKQNQLGISNDLYQAYTYKDDAGEFYLLLTDHRRAITEEKDTLYDNVYALIITSKNNQFKKRSTIKGEIEKGWENSMGFWNQYSQLTDLDNDGLIDPIIVYGTTGQNGYKDGRVRIIAYHMKKRVSIKHQNSEIEDGRLTKISKKFYNFPPQIQKAVIEKMKLLTKNKHAVFSEDWEIKMAKKATRLEAM